MLWSSTNLLPVFETSEPLSHPHPTSVQGLLGFGALQLSWSSLLYLTFPDKLKHKLQSHPAEVLHCKTMGKVIQDSTLLPNWDIYNKYSQNTLSGFLKYMCLLWFPLATSDNINLEYNLSKKKKKSLRPFSERFFSLAVAQSGHHEQDNTDGQKNGAKYF